MKETVIYLASPYSHEDNDVREDRFNRVSKYAAELVAKGYVVISPITYGHTLINYVDMPTDFQFWSKFCIGLLSKCDVMYVYKIDGWENSKGIREEIKYALENNIMVVYVNEI